MTLYFHENKSIRLKQKTIFQDGHKTVFINYDKYDNRTSEGQYEINYKGQIISKIFNGEYERQYQYNELGRINVVYYSNTGAKDIYEYDSNNFAIKLLSISGENSIFGTLLGGPNKKLTTFENDKFGNIITMKVYDEKSDQLLFIQNNKINSQGDEIESIDLNSDSSVLSKKVYKYDYYYKYNWIVKRDLDRNGNFILDQKRQILYYTE